MANCERILLVEDDPDVLETTAEVIEQSGIAVIRCPDGQTALECLRRGPRPDLVLLDLAMPEMSGTEFLSVLRSNDEWRTLPVVAMSGFAAGRFPHVSVDAFVTKPIDADELGRIISELCGTTSRAAVT